MPALLRTTLNGVVGANEGEVREIAPSEVERLRESCVCLDFRPADLTGFVQALTEAAYNLRSLSAQADANTLTARAANLATILQELEAAGVRTARISYLNSQLIQRLRRNGYENAPELETVKEARRKLRKMKVGRGDRPRYELDYCGWQVARAYSLHAGVAPTVKKDGDFVTLLGEVISVALGEPRQDVHRIAERALKGKEEDEGGLTVFVPFDLVESGGS